MNALPGTSRANPGPASGPRSRHRPGSIVVLSWAVILLVAARADASTLVLPATTEPLQWRLPSPAGAGEAGRLVEVDGGRAVPAQPVPRILPDGRADANASDWLVTLLPGPDGRGGAAAPRRFRAEFGGGAPGAGAGADADGARGFRFEEVGTTSLRLVEGDRPVFVYHHGIIRRDGVPADRARSSYVHPIHGLDGEVLTDDFPADHHHHRGLFWAWPHVIIGGKEYDLWMLKGIRHRFERWLAREGGPGGAVLGVENGWFAGDEKVVQERVWLTVHPTVGDQRAIDVDATWIPVREAVTLSGAEGKSYGGLTLRYGPAKGTVITTPLGNGTNDLYMTPLTWADLSARFEQRSHPSGAAIFVAPDHPNYPPTWLTRHYGVLCLGWPGVKARTFQPGEPFRCRYRVWVHRGSPTQDRLESAYHAYTEGLGAGWNEDPTTGPGTAPGKLRAETETGRVRVLVGDSLFTEYHFPPDGKLPHFHPLIGPRSGKSVTTKATEPYPHHASLFLGCDRVNGGNYWQEAPERGRIRSVEVRLPQAGGDRIVIEQDCVWERPGADSPFSDRRRFEISAPGPDRRLIDADITLTAKTDVRILKNNHSLFSARMAPDLAVTGGGRLINAGGGRDEAGTFGVRSPWADYRGRRGEVTEGLTLFVHSTDRWFPPPWFTRDYGFLSPTPMFWLENDELRLARGESIRLRYRVMVHADAPSKEELDALQVAWSAVP